MDRNLAINLVRVTEGAALSAAKLMGRRDKEEADQAGVDGMRKMFDTIDIRGTVVIGEGEKDEAPMLFIGEKVGRWLDDDMEVDIAVDPVEGTTSVANGTNNAIAVIAMAPKGCILDAPTFYMDKIAVGPKAKGKIDINAPIRENLENVARALHKNVGDLTVTILDRPRHKELVQECIDAGARIKLFPDGDIASAIATAVEGTGVDVMMGIGGSPEGVITAAAMKCIGGEIQGKLVLTTDEQREECKKRGIDPDRVLYMDDMVRGNEAYFVATGITDGDMLKGVVYTGDSTAKTHSIVMRSETGTIRFIEATHKLRTKPTYAY